MVGRLLSFWEGLFSGDMLNFRGILKIIDPHFPVCDPLRNMLEKNPASLWNSIEVNIVAMFPE